MINRMNHEEQDELPLRKPVASSSRDREYTLSTGLVLAIFFGLALVCAIFFGFGYTLGRKSLQQNLASDSTTDSSDTSSFSKFKPAAGSVNGSTTSTVTAEPKQEPVSTPAPQPVTSAPSSPASTPAPVVNTPAKQQVAIETQPAPVQRQLTPAVSTPAPAPIPVATGGGSTMVQIAAVSHPEDADVLTAALRRRGYSVVKKQDPGDRLIHVQVGPFPSRKEAEAMKQKLMNDGYNAIIK